MRWLTAVFMRALMLGVIWVGLAGWDASYAVYGLVSVAVTVALSLAWLPPREPDVRSWPARGWAFLSLGGWFLWQSVRGGVDVALRALKPTPDIAPEVMVASLDLPEGPARQVSLILMNLMPGSMVQRLVTSTGDAADELDAVADHVELHTLSAELEPVRQWERLQRRVGRAFGTEVGPGSGTDPGPGPGSASGTVRG